MIYFILFFLVLAVTLALPPLGLVICVAWWVWVFYISVKNRMERNEILKGDNVVDFDRFR